MSIKRLRKAGEILAIWLFWLTFEKVAAVSSASTAGQEDLYGSSIGLLIQSFDRSLSTRLIPAYRFGVVRLAVHPNRRLLYKVELKTLVFSNGFRTATWLKSQIIPIKLHS